MKRAIVRPPGLRRAIFLEVHVVSIVSGPGGTETNGSFVLSEQRAVFNRSEDREVVVTFQWDGAPGPHRLFATWKSPDGRDTSNSAIDYVAKGRVASARTGR